MKFHERITLFFTWILGIGISLAYPVILLVRLFKLGITPRETYSIITGIILLIIFFIYKKWILTIYKRKLDAIAVAEELNQVPRTNFILTRVLKMIEILLPLIGVGLIIYGLEWVFIRVAELTDTYAGRISELFKPIILSISGGFIILLVHDYLRTIFVRNKAVRDKIKLDEKVRKKLEREEIRRQKKIKIK